MYITIKALPNSKQVKLIGKKEFIAIAFDLDNETFVVHIVFFASSDIYPSYRAQIVSFI